MHFADFSFDPDRLLSFVESEIFRNRWKECSLTDGELSELQFEIIARPKIGSVVQGTGGLRKMRFSPAGKLKGKRGAFRVLYCYFEDYGLVLLLTIYPKTKSDDISPAAKKAIRKAIDAQYKLLSQGSEFMTAISNGSTKTKANSVEADVLEALVEFTTALETGEVFKHLQSRKAHATPPNGSLVLATRKLLRLRHSAFGALLGVSSETIKQWEVGAEVPHPTAWRFMEEIRVNPEYWIERSKALAAGKKIVKLVTA